MGVNPRQRPKRAKPAHHEQLQWVVCNTRRMQGGQAAKPALPSDLSPSNEAKVLREYLHRQTTKLWRLLVAKLVTRNGRRQILDERTNMYPSTAMVEIYLSFHGDQNSFLHRRMDFRH